MRKIGHNHYTDYQLSILRNLKKINGAYLALAVFAILIAMFYGNTLTNGFVLDDEPVIVENPYIQSLQHLPKVVTGCIWEAALGGCEGKTLHYRPIVNLSYLLTWQISSSPWFFHLVNLFYFLATVFLVFLLTQALTKNFTLSFFTGLLFLFHPINSESVNWISAVADLTFGIFVLLTLLFYVQYRQTNSVKHFVLALVFYFVAMLSKEIAALVVPLLVLSIDFLRERQELFSLAWLKGNRQRRLANFRFSLFTEWQEIRRYLFFGIPLLLYFVMRQLVLGGLGGLAASGDYLGAFSFGERIFYFLWLFSEYIKSLVFPYPLLFFHKAPESVSVGSLQFLISVVIFLVFAAGLYLALKHGKNIVAFGLLLIGLPLLPVIVFFNIAGESLLGERYLLLSSAGVAVLAASGLNYLWQLKDMRQRKKSARNRIVPEPSVSFLRLQRNRRVLTLVFLGIFFVVSLLFVYPRNKEWKDNVTFLRATVVLNPDAYSMREHLARVLKDQGDREGAQKEYEEIINRNPDWRNIVQIYNKLGALHQENGDFDKAQEYYEKAAQESKTMGDYRGYNNLGVLHVEQGRRLEALVNFCKALQIAPQAQEPKFNFANVASQLDSIDGAYIVLLYRDILRGGAFQKSAEERIRYESRECSPGSCSFRFVTRFEPGELLFPFLILGAISDEKVAKAVNPSFDPQTGLITFQISSEAQDQVISFIFPTCQGTYYEATTTGELQGL